jgi:hypothetical protein
MKKKILSIIGAITIVLFITSNATAVIQTQDALVQKNKLPLDNTGFPILGNIIKYTGYRLVLRGVDLINDDIIFTHLGQRLQGLAYIAIGECLYSLGDALGATWEPPQ